MTPAETPRSLLGGFIRTQRQLANLSLRQLSALTHVSNPYLSQLERGLHQPSVRVLQAIAEALNVSVETLLEQAGLSGGAGRTPAGGAAEGGTEDTIRTDQRLTEAQRRALLGVYRSYVGANTGAETGADTGDSP